MGKGKGGQGRDEKVIILMIFFHKIYKGPRCHYEILIAFVFYTHKINKHNINNFRTSCIIHYTFRSVALYIPGLNPMYLTIC